MRRVTLILTEDELKLFERMWDTGYDRYPTNAYPTERYDCGNLNDLVKHEIAGADEIDLMPEDI